jgi:hypothetical protein
MVSAEYMQYLMVDEPTAVRAAGFFLVVAVATIAGPADRVSALAVEAVQAGKAL